MMKKTWVGMTAMALAMTAATTAFAAPSKDDIDKNMLPYKNGFPSHPGVKPGLVIDASNIDQFKDLFLAGFVKLIKEGYMTVKVGEQTDMAPHPAYLEATYKNAGSVKLGEKPGQIEGFVAGRPFPFDPQPNDPRAGEILAWNYKYGQNWGDSAAITPFYWRYIDMKSGKVEKIMKMNFHFLNFKHRVAQDPKPNIEPNPRDVYRAIYVKVDEPAELRDTQLLIQRFSDDLQFDDANLYLGFQKRVRRLAQGNVTDAFLGSDLMIEDFEGYNSRVSDMKWTYKGKKLALLPIYKRTEVEVDDAFPPPDADGYKYVKFGGKATCFPQITWQLREVYEVEATPVDSNHPVGKRVFLMDKQMGNLNSQVNIYDRKGDLWKTWYVGKTHPDFHLPINKGSGVGVDDAFSMVDLQAQHCTTGHFKGQVDARLNPLRLFSVQNMRAGN